MDDGWKVCPYCGHSPEEEKMREQENDNLRYAPPGYKKDEIRAELERQAGQMAEAGTLPRLQ